MLFTDIQYLRQISNQLRNFKQKSNKLFNCSCPICNDSKTNRLKARGYFYVKNNSLNYICYNCNLSTTFSKMLETIDNSLYKEYVFDSFKDNINCNTTNNTNIKHLPTVRFDIVPRIELINGFWCDQLTSNNIAIQYLHNRKIPIKYYDKLIYTDNFKKLVIELIPESTKLDELFEEPRLVIPYYNEYNVLIGLTGRALNNNKLRYITINVNESIKLIYGLDRIDNNKIIKVCEGQFDSLFINNCLAAGNSDLMNIPVLINNNNVVLIWDCENRNKNIIRGMNNAIKNNYKIVIWPDNFRYKDINDAIIDGISISEINDIIDNNTFYGIEAQLKFNLWKRV